MHGRIDVFEYSMDSCFELLIFIKIVLYLSTVHFIVYTQDSEVSSNVNHEIFSNLVKFFNFSSQEWRKFKQTFSRKDLESVSSWKVMTI